MTVQHSKLAAENFWLLANPPARAVDRGLLEVYEADVKDLDHRPGGANMRTLQRLIEGHPMVIDLPGFISRQCSGVKIRSPPGLLGPT
jgi:hypothetical protein